MLWLIDETKNRSSEIVSCNIHINGEFHELWIEKPSGKTEKIRTSKNADDVNIIKEAIDKAIEIGDTVLRLND